MRKVRTPFLPSYRQAAAFIKATSGASSTTVREMISAIHAQTGTPQNPVDWSAPSQWIEERLQGKIAEIARKIWETDDYVLNPRHCRGSWFLVNNYSLMEDAAQGHWQASDKGEAFLRGDPEVLRQLDEEEGLLDLLTLLSGMDHAKRGDILPEWMAFLQQSSGYSAESSSKSLLHHRLTNLVDRHLVLREGSRYQITDDGLSWLKASFSSSNHDPRKEIIDGVIRFNQAQRQELQVKLADMDPYHFENLVGQLLSAIGYEDVEVTKASGDKGVDVIGRIQVGITTVTEVVQVKRQQGTITRPVVDQLRGALPYHKAIRGTLITLGRFASSCQDAAMFPGAAPITLIDGERLVDLLIDNGIGVHKRRPIELLEVDLSIFEEYPE